MTIVPIATATTQYQIASQWQTAGTQPSTERPRSTISSGRLAGLATAVAAMNVVATVGIDRSSVPARRSTARALNAAQMHASAVDAMPTATESGKRSA